MISFSVRGMPRPEGALRGFFDKRSGKMRRFHDKGKDLNAWRNAIASAAQPHAPSPLWDGPVRLSAVFSLPRPASLQGPCQCGHNRSVHKLRGGVRMECKVGECSLFYEVQLWPSGRPDVDKLLRSLADSLTNVVWKDDSQLVDVTVKKEYGDPGVSVEIRRMGAM